MEVPSWVVWVILGSLLVFCVLLILIAPGGVEQKITSVNCVGSYCTVRMSTGYSFTSPASAIEGRYIVGDCIFLGEPMDCKCVPKSTYDMLMGK